MQLRLVRIESKQFLFISSEKFSCFSNYLLLPHNKNYTNLTDSQYSTWLLKKYSRLQHLLYSGCKTPDFFFWLILLVSSRPSAMRFSHSSSIKTSLGESCRSAMSSASIPFSSSSTITFFSEGLPS